MEARPVTQEGKIKPGKSKNKIQWLAAYTADFLKTEFKGTTRALFSPVKALLKRDWNEVTKAHQALRDDVRKMDERNRRPPPSP